MLWDRQQDGGVRTLVAPELRVGLTRPLYTGFTPLRAHHPLLTSHFLPIALPNPSSTLCLKDGVGRDPVSQG